MGSKQKFAWRPTKVWDMRGMDADYRYKYIWLSWYWYRKPCNVTYYTLDGKPIKDIPRFITSNNKW